MRGIAKAVRPSALLLGLVALLATVGLAGCVSTNMRYERAIGAPSYPPTNPADVRILRHEPQRPNVRLGHIVLRPEGDPPIADLERSIREGAAALGADAAVLVRDSTHRIGIVYEGPWWARSAYPVYGRVIVAVAIKYEDRGPRA